VKQRPKLADIVLKWSSREQEARSCIKIKKCLPPLRLIVFDVLSLIQDHIVPLLSFEDGLVSYHDLVAGNANVKRIEA
jgi:hypothetical protein